MENYSGYTFNKSNIIKDINQNLLGGVVYSFVEYRETTISKYISNLPKIKAKSQTGRLLKEIFTNVDPIFIKNLIICQFLSILTFKGTNEEDKLSLLNVTLQLGRKTINKYLYTLILNSFKSKNNDLKSFKYSDALSEWKSKDENQVIYELLKDDTFVSKLGGMLIDILESSDMLVKRLVVISRVEKMWVLDVVNDDKLNNLSKRSIRVVPNKLPMICKPIDYTPNALGGFLLNDKRYQESLFVEKPVYGIASVVDPAKDKSFYHTINNISKTPFKINHILLDYITSHKGSHLLLDATKEHEYHNKDKRSKREDSVLKSYNSKVVLQEMILEIVDFYKNYSEIFFPVKLDHRGRLYPTPNYFNYQSNELSKALLLFAHPAVIARHDIESIKYLKAFGANCFGGNISKKSIYDKCAWVDKNSDNIVYYEDNILINKAQDKLLFLALVIEYKRYVHFLDSEKSSEFETYLPVQLDASCNGFQHMAMLSNERFLFEVLNLVISKDKHATINNIVSNQGDIEPKDFYNFILYKVTTKIQEQIDLGNIVDEKTKGNYERLSKFVWARNAIKKSIMTIPYNASARSMQMIY